MKRIVEIDLTELVRCIFTLIPSEINNKIINEYDFSILSSNGLNILNEDEENFLIDHYYSLSDQDKYNLDIITNIYDDSEDYTSSIKIIEKYITNNIESFFNRMPYQMFLHTSYWHAIRGYKKQITGNKCQLCSSKNHLHVHHNDYQHKGSEYKNMNDLTVLCNKCHSRHHDKGEH